MHAELLPALKNYPSERSSDPASTRRYPDAPKALFILDAETQDLIYGPPERAALEKRANFYAPPQTSESIVANPALLADVEVLFSGWGAPKMDKDFLDAAPNLRAVFYGAGSIHSCTSEAFWERDILISSAAVANAVPVAEYTLGVILLSLKHFWRFAAQAKVGAGWGNHTRHVPGGFGSTVALIGCGAIARRVIALLQPFEVRRIVYDPFLSQVEAATLGVELCTLEEAFSQGDVISLHVPHKPSTEGMITGELFFKMKNGGTFINTSRGRIVRQEEMIAVLKERPDLSAVLDVCDPEPAPVGSPLLALDNVVVTSHISGSHGPECQRLGRYMVEEFERYLAGEPLKWQITKEIAAKLA